MNMDEEYYIKKALEKLEDLKKKLETKESLPEKELDLSAYLNINDGLDEILGIWYY